MKKIISFLPLFFLFFCCFLFSAAAQPYRNEWINFSSANPYSLQEYYRIKIVKEGIYRIDMNTLTAATVPATTSNLDPRKIQIFYQGVEQYIYIKGEDDGKFDSSDYIEFYAKKNDGSLDATMYKNKSSQQDVSLCANPNYSLFTDTAVYYLTWANGSVKGKRMLIETNMNYTGTPLPYFIKDEYHEFISGYFPGEPNGEGGSDPDYIEGEGWFGPAFSLGSSNTLSKDLNTQNIYSQGTSAQLKTVVIGASNAFVSPDHHLNIQLQGGTSAFTFDTVYEGYKMLRMNLTVPLTALSANSTKITYSALGYNNSSVDRNTVSYISLRYPHIFKLENESNYTLYIPNSSSAYSYLEISDFKTNNSSVYLYDLSNHRRIHVTPSGNILKAMIFNPSSTGEKQCFLTSESQISKAVLQTVNPDVKLWGKFTNYYSFNPIPDYIIITHTKLLSEAEKYKQYRSSAEGGNYKVLVVDVSNLYDQFSYGIQKHPLAIKNFVDYISDKWTAPPQHLFLIGKSLETSEKAAENARADTKLFEQNLVPTYGYPPSDILLSSGLNGTRFEPLVPVGRLAAKTKEDVALYLNKVKEYESQTTAEWMKNVLHFGGGTNKSSQDMFKTYLNQYKDTVEDIYFGGHVTTFLKTSSDPIQFNISDKLKKMINDGVSLMTFFGHAYSGGFDQNVNEPADFKNKGKYPFLISNGCYSGDIHLVSGSVSEKFVLIADKGSIGFLATVTAGLAPELHEYTSAFYGKFSREYYGEPVAKCIKESIKNIQVTSSSVLRKIQCLAMTLHGDPAIVINAQKKPDLFLTSSNIYFTPTVITSEMDSFSVNIICTNIGKTTKDSFYVKIKRIFPDGTYIIYTKKVKPVHYRDTLTFWLKPEDSGAGLNTFEVMLDDSLQIDELSETNNFASASVFIQSTDIIPIYPYKYAIVPKNTVTLKASTANPFAPSRTYRFEIDTTDAFNSDKRQTGIITQGGGVVSWGPIQLLPTDSTVYYWRVGIDSAGKVLRGKESSFIFITGKTGWSQAHFYQFLKGDKYKSVDTIRTKKEFAFVKDVQTLASHTFNYALLGSGNNGYLIDYSVNNIIYNQGTCAGGQDVIVVIWFDILTGAPQINHRKKDGNNIYTNDGEYGSSFQYCNGVLQAPHFDMATATQPQRDSLKKLLDAIPDGSKFIIYSVKNTNAKNFDAALIKAFKDLGLNNKALDSLRDTVNYPNVPFIMMGRKGTPSITTYTLGKTPTVPMISLVDTMHVNWTKGYIYSETIGPAKKWGSFHWRYIPMESNSMDEILIDITGRRKDGSETVLLPAISEDSLDILTLDLLIDVKEYPYLKLQAYLRDDKTRTPPQLKKWQIYFDELPEAALNPSRYFNTNIKENMQQGDSVRMDMAIENISPYPMDSMWVDFWITDNERAKHTLPYQKLDSLRVGSFIIASVKYRTDSLPGINNLWIEANPFNTEHQLEQYHFNNIAQISFNSEKDNINPLLDVTFDGVHILNGDIVSAKPVILIQLKDENKRMVLDDTSDFAVFIKTPSAKTAEKVYFEKLPETKGEAMKMQWKKARLPENRFRIEYNPVFPEDGTYEMLVQAKDKSDNLSGMYDYRISFEVINKSTITEVLNYPNPFSTSTRFAFVLTGSEIPTYFKIQVLTVSGKVVREITLDELGAIHIGRNVTEYAWDGKDEFGNQLANGVYLYRAITRLNGEKIEHRETGADSYFKNGWGKLYLMR